MKRKGLLSQGAAPAGQTVWGSPDEHKKTRKKLQNAKSARKNRYGIEFEGLTPILGVLKSLSRRPVWPDKVGKDTNNDFLSNMKVLFRYGLYILLVNILRDS